MPDLRRFLEDTRARPLVLDAASGTRLLGSGLDLERDDPALWVVDHAEIVAELHANDARAGADVITTCTFGANATWLARYGRAGEVAAINRAAVALARRAGAGLFVLGSIGPTAGDADSFRSQALALEEAGADGLLLETQSITTALAALSAIRETMAIPIVVSLFRWVSDVERSLIDAGADALGINCVDPARARVWVEGRPDGETVPILVRPSASSPERRTIDPDRFARTLANLVEDHPEVRFVGGCCGSTDRDVAAIRRALDLDRTSRL